jgi:hypothetical protein
MSESTVDGVAKSGRSDIRSVSVEDEPDDLLLSWGLRGKLVYSSTISQQFTYSLGLGSQPSLLVASNQRLTRRTAHADEPSLIGRKTIIWSVHTTTSRSAPQACPWTGQHISMRYPNPRPRLTTLYGTPQQLWKKTSGVIRHGVLFSRGVPLPPYSNWR